MCQTSIFHYLQTLERHWLAYADIECDSKLVMNPGNLHWRNGGERHVNDPVSVANLQVWILNKIFKKVK